MQQDSIELGYRGGLAGTFAPLFLFLAGVTWLGTSGAPGEQGFWPILVAALTLGMMLARDRHAYAEAVIDGMSQPIIMVMILAWLLAGILAALMKAGGFVDALVWLSHSAGLGGAGFVVAAFLISAAVSTSTGTSLGTVILCSPLLYPAGGPLDAPPAVLLGAILGGATFGDNISPVSDTTIASTVTQGARMGEVVRARLRYALPAAGLALVAYVVAAMLMAGPSEVAEPTGVLADADRLSAPADPGTVAEPGSAIAPASGPEGLPMLLAPLLVVFLLFRHVHLLEGLIFGVLTAAVIGIAIGLIRPGDLIYVDPDSFSAAGILVEGMQRGVGVSIFTILLMGLVAGLEASGVIRRLLDFAEDRIRSPRSAEWWSFGTVSMATLLTTHSVVALLAVGPFARETGFKQGISAVRRANILDTTVCTYPFLLPYCIPTILAASTTLAGPDFGMPILPAITAGLFNFHSWALLGIVLVAIATGWGRGTKEDSRIDSIREPIGSWDSNDPPSSASDPFDLGQFAEIKSRERRQWGSSQSERRVADRRVADRRQSDRRAADRQAESSASGEDSGSGSESPGMGTEPMLLPSFPDEAAAQRLFQETERIEPEDVPDTDTMERTDDEKA